MISSHSTMAVEAITTREMIFATMIEMTAMVTNLVESTEQKIFSKMMTLETVPADIVL